MNWSWRDRDAVIEADRADRQVQADAEAPVVVEHAGAKAVGIVADAADVEEHREAHADAVLLLEDGDAVFDGAEPEGVAADRLVIGDCSGSQEGLCWRGLTLRYLKPRRAYMPPR